MLFQWRTCNQQRDMFLGGLCAGNILLRVNVCDSWYMVWDVMLLSSASSFLHLVLNKHFSRNLVQVRLGLGVAFIVMINCSRFSSSISREEPDRDAPKRLVITTITQEEDLLSTNPGRVGMFWVCWTFHGSWLLLGKERSYCTLRKTNLLQV